MVKSGYAPGVPRGKSFGADKARGKRLRHLRENVEYADQASVAAGTGLSVPGIRKWEAGGEIERKSIAALARYYGANPRWIMEEQGPMLRPPDEFLDRLEQLEAEVTRQGRQLADLLGELEGEGPGDEQADSQRAASAAARAAEGSRSGSRQSQR